MNLFLLILLTLVLIGLEFGGDYVLTNVDAPKMARYGYGVLIYILIAFLWAHLVVNRNKTSLAFINGVWQIGSVVVITILSWIILKEQYNTMDIVGIVISIIGLVILCISSYMRTLQLPK